ncbi:hypothetical protein [Shewanella maritima]|uniref:hypothetical protein n=1 Tax=Shewanella maritima TaxID=2520507 RepID=UPI003736085D
MNNKMPADSPLKTAEPEQTLQQLIDSAPQKIKPKRDLWSAVEQQISDSEQSAVNSNVVELATKKKGKPFNGQSPVWKPLALAASVGLVAMFTWQLSGQRPVDNNLNQQAQIPSSEADMGIEGVSAIGAEPNTQQLPAVNRNSTASLTAVVIDIAKAHQQQIAQLETSLQQVAWQSDDALFQGINELRLAADKTQQALMSQPENQGLWQLWLWLHQREINLLKQQTQYLQFKHQQSTQGMTI